MARRAKPAAEPGRPFRSAPEPAEMIVQRHSSTRLMISLRDIADISGALPHTVDRLVRDVFEPILS
jgi:hypothetical protein